MNIEKKNIFLLIKKYSPGLKIRANKSIFKHWKPEQKEGIIEEVKCLYNLEITLDELKYITPKGLFNFIKRWV